jgi:predicted nucleotidyltransferase
VRADGRSRLCTWMNAERVRDLTPSVVVATDGSQMELLGLFLHRPPVRGFPFCDRIRGNSAGLDVIPRLGIIEPILGMSRDRSGSRRKSLASAIFTRTQQRVLGLLFAHPERSFYASELIRQAGTGSGAAQRELARLERSGLITARRIGHQRHFQANADSPLFPELRAIVLKTVGLAEPLRHALAPLSSAIRAAFVYGSIAKETDRSQSDVDLMVISDSVAYGDVFAVLDNTGRALGRQVNATVYTTAEFSKRVREENAFVMRVLEQPKVWIIGSEHDLSVAA